MPSRPGFLPSLGSFVGRTRELARLRERLSLGARLVTITGLGGVGKTRLALEHLSRARTSNSKKRPRASCFCDLSDARTAESISTEVARALGVTLDAASTFEEARHRVGRALARRGPMLVVLDNLEQVARHAPETLRHWMDAAPAVQFLATSRVRLRIRGEECIELLPLALSHDGETSEGARLFLDRVAMLPAVAAAPYANADARTIAAIVERLEGIPLAIELCAARAGLWSPEELLTRLSSDRGMLERGYRDLPERQATLFRTIDWSWKLLAPKERRALAACSVFRGGFTLDAWRAVVGGDPRDAERSLETLRDHSLARVYEAKERPREPRFALYESVREVAAIHLRGAAKDTADARHRDFYLRTAGDAAKRAIDAAGFARLELERANLIAIVDRALARTPTAESALAAIAPLLALEPLFARNGPMSSYVEWLDRAIAHAARVRKLARKHPVRRLVGRGLVARAKAHAHLGQTRAADDGYKDAAAAARATSDRAGLVLALHGRGLVAHRRGFYEEARTSLDEALADARALEDPWLEALVVSTIAVQGKTQGFRSDILPTLEVARALFHAAGDDYETAVVELHIATICLEYGHLEDAARHADAAMPVFRGFGDDANAGLAETVEGSVMLEHGPIENAIHRFEQSMERLAARGFWRADAICSAYLGVAFHIAGRFANACERYTYAIDAFRAGSDEANALLFMGYRGAVRCALGDVGGAEREFASIHAVLPPSLDRLHAQTAHVHEGHLSLARARDAMRAGDSRVASQHRRDAEDRIARARAPDRPWIRHSNDVRLAVRLLSAALREETSPREALVVAHDGSWFRPPNGARVDFPRQHALRGILRLLSEHRIGAPGSPVDRVALAASGWPGERLPARVSANRVYVAIDTLKRRGLRDLILREPTGWRLANDVPLLWAIDGDGSEWSTSSEET